MASSTHNSGSPAEKVLYFIRRNGGHATEEQMVDRLGMDRIQVRVAANELMRHQAVTTIEGS